MKRTFSWRRTAKIALAAGATAATLGWLAWLTLPDPLLYPKETTWSREVRDRDGVVLHLTLTRDGRYRLFTPLGLINREVIEATLLHEDRHFYQHPGINPFSLMRGAAGWITNTKRGGGSTITMQYARLRWRLNTRSVPGKFLQIVRAFQIERHHTKDEILEAYLNLAPYGGNVEGIGAASLLWCGKSQADLTLREAVTLSVLPQSPARRKPLADADNQFLAAAQLPLIRQIQARRNLRNDPLEESFTLRAQRTPPRGAPHLSRRLLSEQPARTSIKTTIDAAKQRLIEAAMEDYLSRKQELGINNACAMLVHAPSRHVLGYAGSARFLDGDIQGQVDGVTARRSPGSALKPFIYALALDQGLIHPRTLLNDARLSFGDYNPENFDRGFAGPITAADALFRSRNVPAVALTQRLHAPGLYGLLKNGGVAFPQSAQHYGLALPLGGAEVTMEELAALYAMLANSGEPGRLRFDFGAGNDPAASRVPPLLSPASCFLVREMLRQPDVTLGADDPSVSWKTGTSHGFRDAWAAGIRGEFVLVVWIGNFNGKPNPSFVARECAAPLLFEMFRRLDLPYHSTPKPAAVTEVDLCAVSGQLPTPLCRHQVRGGFIPGVSPIQPCQIHQEILIDGSSGLRVAADDGRPGLARQIYECWPPDTLALFKHAGLPRKEPPPFEKTSSLSARGSGDDLHIDSPRASLVYHLRTHDTAQRSIPLRAATAPGVRKVYWFAGTQFVGTSTPAEPFLWQANAGTWIVHVLDDHGRSASCQIRVEEVQ